MGVQIAPTPFRDYMEDCIFCKIVNGEIPAYKVYEDENFFAFLDINPRNPGHTLIIPKKHFRWVWDVNASGYFEAVRNVAIALKKAMNTEYVVSGIAGKEVPHAHIHLIPRMEGDGHGEFLDQNKFVKLSKEEMEKIAAKIESSF